MRSGPDMRGSLRLARYVAAPVAAIALLGACSSGDKGTSSQEAAATSTSTRLDAEPASPTQAEVVRRVNSGKGFYVYPGVGAPRDDAQNGWVRPIAFDENGDFECDNDGDVDQRGASVGVLEGGNLRALSNAPSEIGLRPSPGAEDVQDQTRQCISVDDPVHDGAHGPSGISWTRGADHLVAASVQQMPPSGDLVELLNIPPQGS